MKVKHYDNAFYIQCQSWETPRIKQAPDAQKTSKDVYMLPETLVNAQWLEREAGKHELSSTAIVKIKQIKGRPAANERFPAWYDFKTTPMSHQMDALNAAWQKEQFGLFMEMGVGKSWVAIQLACAYRMNNGIDAMLIVCPTAIKPVWEIELEKHSPIPVDPFVLEAGGYKAMQRWVDQNYDFPILIVGVEALSQGKAVGFVQKFVESQRTFMVIDESSRIKNFESARTESCWDIGAAAAKRMIMTGTPISQGMQDLFAQLYFLNWEIIGQKSFYAFRNRYCILGGFENKSIIGYENVGELLELTAPHIFIITKDEALDLPDKVFEVRHVEASKAQKKAILELRDLHETQIEDQLIECETMLERMTRFQQICGGNYPYQEDPDDPASNWSTKPLPGKNPKMDELVSILDDISADARVIIWARFVPEIELIRSTLQKKYGDVVLDYYGATEDRRKSVDWDNGSPRYRYMVSNQAIGGMGITWIGATYVIYYSNTFSYQDRVQSEDRCHRKGQTNKVTYIDIVLNTKEDKMIRLALEKKQNMAQYVTENLVLTQQTLGDK